MLHAGLLFLRQLRGRSEHRHPRRTFGLGEKKAQATRVIKDTMTAGLIKQADQDASPATCDTLHTGPKVKLEVSLGGLLGCSGGMWARETAGLQADCCPLLH